MMEIISNYNLDSIKQHLDFYNFKTSESKYKTIIVKFKDEVEVTTFSDLSSGGNIDYFHKQATLIKNMFFTIIDSIKGNEVLITRYADKWINNKNCLELMDLFKKMKLKTNFEGGIKTSDRKVLEIFFNGNIKYCSFVNFIIFEKELIITPTDHMDIFINSTNPEETLRNVRKIKEDVDINDLLVVEEFNPAVQ